MKKEIIISIIVIAIVIIGNIITQNNTKQYVTELDGELAELKNSLIDVINNKKKVEYYLKCKEKSTNIRDRWDEIQEVLSFYIEHDELEKVEIQLAVVNGQMESKLYDEAVAEIEKCQFILEHIADKTAFNIKNIF